MAQEAYSRIPMSLINSALSTQRMLASIKIPATTIERLFNQAQKATEIWNKIDFSQITKSITTIEKVFSTIAWENVIKQSEQIFKILKDLELTEDTVKEANEELMKMGWWIYPEWTIPSLKHIAKACREGKTEEVRQEIIGFFDKDRLKLIVKSWKKNPKLNSRYKSLKDGVWAHKQRKYTLSIPTVLPHVEGIINENSGQTGHISHKKCLTILKKYMDKDIKGDSLSSLYPLAMLKFTEELLAQKFEWGKPSKKGRHPILHGHYTDYDDEEFSLKLILLIDFLQNIIRKENQ
ncbi:MAG: hypothetical protein JRI72_02250 [Deltaproteobacteria bacterium]|nr:hypothetical protein [Deltaproteobacteria bacterium]